MNGDGFDDVIMGAWGASSGAGEVLVIFGADSHPAVVGASDLDGITGFLIWGATTSDASGFSVSSGGVSAQPRVATIISCPGHALISIFFLVHIHQITWETVYA